MEELVAFGNADGGVLVLGVVETDVHPARADVLNPLPDVAGLERRLRDVIVDCVEPRLPQAAVVGLPTTPEGAGVVILEVEPSRLGPHRVRKTREATIRRGDSCVPLTMAEIHDMVIRNARRFDAVALTLIERLEGFQNDFTQMLVKQVPAEPAVPEPADLRVSRWLSKENYAAFGLRVTLVPHDALGIARLEHLTGLVPPQSVREVREAGTGHVPGADVVWITEHGGRRVLGGVEQVQREQGLVRSYRVMRDGFIEANVMSCDKRDAVQVPL